MELLTPRLRLREFTLQDEPSTHSYASDVEVTRHTLFGPNTEADTRAYLERTVARQSREPRLDITLAVELRQTGDHIGAVGLHLDGEQAELGYVFHKAYWHRGYAPEAARALVDFGFTTLRLHRIAAHCDIHNPASARVMVKLGMRHEGTFLKASKMKGEWRDEWLYAVLASEWLARPR